MPLQEPSERERDLYYCGLPTCPKLIARSSSMPWPQPHEFVGNKKLSVATGHAIQQPWNDPRGTLQPLIIATLTDIDWTAIDILRVGYEVNYKVPGRTFEGPVTMLISMSPNSTPFHRAEAVIVFCKQILARFALDDVEVEVKESIVATAASYPTTDQQALNLESGPFKNNVDDIKFKFSHHVSEYIGTSIGVPETFKGTKGLYLQGKDSKTYALTCHHVLFPKDSTDYRHGNSDNIKQAIQPALGTTFDLLRYFPGEKFTIETSIRLTTHPRYNILAFQAELPKLLQKQALLDSFEAHFDYLTSAGSFGLGRFEIAPRIQLYTDDKQLYSKRIRDWALVELSQESLITSLSDLTNKVPVTQLFRDGFKEHKDTVTHGALLPVNTSPEVKIGPDLISEAELENSAVSGIADQQRLVVVKFGCSSGVTFGYSNSIRSVVRHPHPPGAATTAGIVSNHWCIVDVEKKAPFSKGGDSGACIFDLRGRIGGIMTAGLAASDKPNPDGFDVTYATPMQWLLEDIARHGYDVDLPN